MALPCRTGTLADDPDFPARATDITQRHVQAITDEVTELAELGLVKSASVELRISEATLNLSMEVRILHHHEPGYGWSFDSPDIPGLVGGTDEYDPAEAEHAALFALACEADEQGKPAPEHVAFEHFVPTAATA